MRPLRRNAALGLLLAALPGIAPAVQVDSLEVTKHDARYRVTMAVRLDVPAERAWAVFTDYSNLPRINPAVKRADLLPETTTPDVSRLFTQMRLCFSFFCKTLEQVQDMRPTEVHPGGKLAASVLPERSDLRYGQADWSVRACGEQAACLDFAAELEPRFWIPPVIGPWVMERKLRQEAVQTSQGIERLAREAMAAAPAAAP